MYRFGSKTHKRNEKKCSDVENKHNGLSLGKTFAKWLVNFNGVRACCWSYAFAAFECKRRAVVTAAAIFLRFILVVFCRLIQNKYVVIMVPLSKPITAANVLKLSHYAPNCVETHTHTLTFHAVFSSKQK